MTTTTTTKTKSVKKAADHPTYEDMIKNAILTLKERKGSSRPAIKKYILANYNVSPGATFDTHIASAIKRGYEKKVFLLPKGLSGSIKLAKVTTKEPSTKKTKAVTKKKATVTKQEPVKKESVKKEPVKRVAKEMKPDSSMSKKAATASA